MQKEDGADYKDSSINNGYNALNRYLKSKVLDFENTLKTGSTTPYNKELDLNNKVDFKRALRSLESKLIGVQKDGNTGTNSSDILTEEEEKRLLDSSKMSIHSPEGLVNRVWFVAAKCLLSRGKK